MADLKIKMAAKIYDRTLPFFLGRIKPQGIELEMVDITEGAPKPPGLGKGHPAHMHAGLVDCSEHSASVYLVMKEMGCDFTAIPVFPHRRFRHAYIFVHRDAGIKTPKDLEGRKVGVPRLANTAALWARGALTHAYDVDYSKVHWVPFSEEYAEGMEKSKEVDLAAVMSNKSEAQALIDGDVDAYISPSESDEMFKEGSVITRLFPNFREEEQEYFRRTQLFPIMHTFVVRDNLLQNEPWIVGSLMDAWNESMRRTYRWVRDQRKSILVWAGDYYLQEREFFGDFDPWKMDFQYNYKALDALCQYGYEQKLVETRFKPEDIWVTGPTS
ncbi:MAG: 4,5-dihydroxyphthalate decarboxylase [Chloroflexota bacterium]|nr:4,5-dihydroxyphthalate decarboxylase [Chloroflexota bacterium]